MEIDSTAGTNDSFRPSTPPSGSSNEPPLEQSEKRKREENEEEGERERDHPKPLWKTSLCSYFRRPGSVCSHGESCRYAHGEAELRQRPDSTWDPTSQRAKKLLKHHAEEEEGDADAEEEEEEALGDPTSLDKCLIGLPRKWNSDKLKSFLDDQGIHYATAKKKKGMTVGFVSFDNVEQIKSAIEILRKNDAGVTKIKIADAIRRPQTMKIGLVACTGQKIGELTENHLSSEDPTVSTPSLAGGDDDAGDRSNLAVEVPAVKPRSVRDVVTPLAHMPYVDQLELKKNSLLQTLKRLTRNARKACPDSVQLPDWILKSRDIGGLPCKLEGILESPVVDGYRNKCEFSVGYSLQGKPTVGFMLGNFREGMTAVEEPINCPNVSRISCKYAFIFQEFLESSDLPVWNRIENVGFWRQFTVREGRSPIMMAGTGNPETQIAEVMLIIQVCSSDTNEEVMKSEFRRLAQTLPQKAAECSPPLPLTTIIVQDHKGISNAAPADCPLYTLPISKIDECPCDEKGNIAEARIHDYISDLRFCISPTAFFQVNTLAAERLYSLAGDWANLSPDTLLFDICCGTGTIGLTLARRVGMVVGIEMNESAVSNAQRNAEINDIQNCTFVCGKAEDVMGALLKEYLDGPRLHDISSDISDSNKQQDADLVATEKHDGAILQPVVSSNLASACGGELAACSDDANSERTLAEQQFGGDPNRGETLPGYGIENESNGFFSNDESGQVNIITGSSGSVEESKLDSRESTLGNSASLDTSMESHKLEEKKTKSAAVRQFKDVVAIVDPPRVGLHPIVIKVLRTHPRIRRLVYVSCNPESLVANAIELCTPTADNPEKAKGNRRWRSMSSAGLARQRTKSMPSSEPFGPVRAMAVDLFPHTPHCEMVMLFER